MGPRVLFWTRELRKQSHEFTIVVVQLGPDRWFLWSGFRQCGPPQGKRFATASSQLLPGAHEPRVVHADLRRDEAERRVQESCTGLSQGRTSHSTRGGTPSRCALKQALSCVSKPERTVS
eukprot:2511171-Rhodomonas_salina.1